MKYLKRNYYCNVATMLLILVFGFFSCSKERIFFKKPKVHLSETKSVGELVYLNTGNKPYTGVVIYKYGDMNIKDESGNESKINSDYRAMELEYKNGIPDGKCVWYFFDGKTIIETGFYKNGEKHGKWIEWYDDQRTIKMLKEYINGEKHGHWIEWNRKRKIIFEEIWENGKLIKKIK